MLFIWGFILKILRRDKDEIYFYDVFIWKIMEFNRVS